MTQKPDPKRRSVARASESPKQVAARKGKEDREAQVRDLTEQCLELMDRLAEAGEERDRLRDRCAGMEDELARSQREAMVSRERVSWLEAILSQMHKTSEHIQAEALEGLKHETAQAAEADRPRDLEERFERLGKGIDLEHQTKSGLINTLNALRAEVNALQAEVNALQAEAAAARGELIELAARSGASEEEQKRIKAELEQERSSRQAAMDRLREEGITIRELRAILGLHDGESGPALVQWIRNLQATINDRDRWVAALLAELANRRLKLTRRGLMDHERKFLEEQGRAKGS